MVSIKSTGKLKILLITSILLVAQLVPILPSLSYAEASLPIELKVEESPNYFVDDTILLLIKKNDKGITKSVVTLSPNVLVDRASVEMESSDLVSFNEEENEFVIEWSSEDSATLAIAVKLVEAGSVEITSSNFLAEEIYQSNIIQLSVNPLEEIPSEEPVDEELVEEDEGETSISEESDEEKEAPDLEEEIGDAADEEEESGEELTEEQEAVEEVEFSAESTESVEPQAADDYRLVGSGAEFRNALEDANVKNIRIEEKFNATGHMNMNGDKYIDGNGQTLNFYGYKIQIGEYSLSVENLTIEAVQGNFPSVGTFNSDHPDAVLKLENTSYGKVEHAQVARMLQGHIYVSGTVYFETSGPFEVFEAKNITFEEDAKFTGITTGTGPATRKEVLNLYNSPTVTIGKNASVRLGTKGSKSIIRVEDSSAATINVMGGGKLHIYSDNRSRSVDKGEPLVNLPNAGSEILLAPNATLDIQNYRDGKHLGALLHMNGNLVMSDNLSKVALWDKDANTNNQFGDRYRHFPEINRGEFTLRNDQIIESHATEDSSLSISDNPDKDGQTFQDTFTNRNTKDMKRLLITSIAEKEVLELRVPERLNFQPTVIEFEEIIIPRVNPDWSMQVKDTRGQGSEWEITAQAESPLKSRSGHELDENALIFTQNNDEYTLKEAVLIQKGLTGETPETMIEWHEDEGIFIKINPMESEILADTEYATNIVWTIKDAP